MSIIALSQCWTREKWMAWLDNQPQDLLCGLLFLDADNLKQVNDTQGHQAGDDYLNALVDAVKKSLRQTDHIIRWGGDEFVVISPSCTFLPAIDELSKRLTRALTEAQVECSIGYALRQPDEEWDAVINRADQHMYKMKAQHHAAQKKTAKKQNKQNLNQKRDQIYDTIDMLSVAQQYIALKKTGAVWRGLCPFHGDHDHPNLTVYPGTKRENGHYHCFACNEHGDVIEFIKKINHVTIAAAMNELLGSTWDTPMPERRTDNVWGEWEIPTMWINRYAEIWPEIALFPEHQEQLTRRGLSLEAINSHAFKSMPNERIGWMRKMGWTAEDIRGLPGFSWKDDGHWHGPRGFMIPVRQQDTRIVGAQIHPDNGDTAKYLWWSTANDEKYPGGGSSGSPPHWAWPGNHPYDDVAELWITEGPLKAIIAAEYLEMPVIGVAGISRFNAVLPLLERIQPSRVIVAMDADTQTSPALAETLAQALHAFSQVIQPNHLWVAQWDPAAGKGIDDILVANQTWDISRAVSA